MMLEKLCLLLLFFQGQFIFKDSSITAITIYTTEGSTFMLTFTQISQNMTCEFHANIKSANINSKLRPLIMAIQMINVTTNDTGRYQLCDKYHDIFAFALKMTNTFHRRTKTCAIESSYVLRYKTDLSLCHNGNKVEFLRRKNFRKVSNFAMHLEVTSRCKNFRWCRLFYVYTTVLLKVAKLWFINQTDSNTIVGQIGTAMEINCSSDTEQHITTLKLESNGSIKAIGDNQTVSYSFIPERTDHLTKYKCMDSTHSSIMIEVKLIIMYPPEVTVRYTNETVECDCDGNPNMYSVYRLDKISMSGELVRSVNLNNGTFNFQTDTFPYQRNGRYMCVVSNGVPDTNGEILQNWSINVNYEGPPVFAKENRRVKVRKVGQSSISLSFHVYSCPAVKEIFLEKLGQMRGKQRKINKYILKSTLLYNELDNTVEIHGYDILIESDEFDIDGFQAYSITVKNRLGASDYHFEIIKKENVVMNQREEKYFVTLCIVGAVLLSSIIANIGFCVKLIWPRHGSVLEDTNYHTYDEIGTISYRAAHVSNSHSSDTNENRGQNMREQHVAGISTGINLQSADDNTTELNEDVLDDWLQHRDITELQGLHMSMSSNDTNLSDPDLSQITSTAIPNMENILNRNTSSDSTNKETSSDQTSQTSNGSHSETSNNVMVGNVGDGYENSYQTVFQDQPESDPYIEIIRKRHNSVLSTDSNTNEEQILETDSKKEPVYINLQF